jgi:hypothetical protein
MRPSATSALACSFVHTSVCGLQCMRPEAHSVRGLKLIVYEALYAVLSASVLSHVAFCAY